MRPEKFPLTDPSSTPGFEVRVPIRWSDMDIYRHINHAKMVTILEEARIPWLFADDVPTSTLATGTVITDLHIRYIEQLRHRDGPLSIKMWVTKIRAVDFTSYYEVRPHGADPGSRAAVVASTQLAVFDIDEQRLRRITAVERDYLEKFIR